MMDTGAEESPVRQCAGVEKKNKAYPQDRVHSSRLFLASVGLCRECVRIGALLCREAGRRATPVTRTRHASNCRGRDLRR